MANMSKKQYNQGSFYKLWDYMVELHKTNPQAFNSADYLFAHVQQKWAAFRDKTRCPNCKGSMLEYIYVFDFHNALLLKTMGKVVAQRLREGMEFQEANKVHVVSMDAPDHTRHRTTQAAKLGLIAKVKLDGVHDRRQGWLITKRGWEALRGIAVPSYVRVFQNEIIERSDVRITIGQVFEAYRERTAETVLKGKTLKSDYRQHTLDYDPMEWVNFGNVHHGEIL